MNAEQLEGYKFRLDKLVASRTYPLTPEPIRVKVEKLRKMVKGMTIDDIPPHHELSEDQMRGYIYADHMINMISSQWKAATKYNVVRGGD
jgi:hypothetical protein